MLQTCWTRLDNIIGGHSSGLWCNHNITNVVQVTAKIVIFKPYPCVYNSTLNTILPMSVSFNYTIIMIQWTSMSFKCYSSISVCICSACPNLI